MEDTQRSPILGANWKTGLILIVALLALWNAPAALWRQVGFSGYTCAGLVEDVVEASKDRDSILGIKLIDVVEIQKVSQSRERLDCKGLGIFNNGDTAPIVYSAYEEYGKWWVKYEMESAAF